MLLVIFFVVWKQVVLEVEGDCVGVDYLVMVLISYVFDQYDVFVMLQFDFVVYLQYQFGVVIVEGGVIVVGIYFW